MSFDEIMTKRIKEKIASDVQKDYDELRKVYEIFIPDLEEFLLKQESHKIIDSLIEADEEAKTWT